MREACVYEIRIYYTIHDLLVTQYEQEGRGKLITARVVPINHYCQKAVTRLATFCAGSVGVVRIECWRGAVALCCTSC